MERTLDWLRTKKTCLAADGSNLLIVDLDGLIVLNRIIIKVRSSLHIRLALKNYSLSRLLVHGVEINLWRRRTQMDGPSHLDVLRG